MVLSSCEALAPEVKYVQLAVKQEEIWNEYFKIYEKNYLSEKEISTSDQKKMDKLLKQFTDTYKDMERIRKKIVIKVGDQVRMGEPNRETVKNNTDTLIWVKQNYLDHLYGLMKVEYFDDISELSDEFVYYYTISTMRSLIGEEMMMTIGIAALNPSFVQQEITRFFGDKIIDKTAISEYDEKRDLFVVEGDYARPEPEFWYDIIGVSGSSADMYIAVKLYSDEEKLIVSHQEIVHLVENYDNTYRIVGIRRYEADETINIESNLFPNGFDVNYGNILPAFKVMKSTSELDNQALLENFCSVIARKTPFSTQRLYFEKDQPVSTQDYINMAVISLYQKDFDTLRKILDYGEYCLVIPMSVIREQIKIIFGEVTLNLDWINEYKKEDDCLYIPWESTESIEYNISEVESFINGDEIQMNVRYFSNNGKIELYEQYIFKKTSVNNNNEIHLIAVKNLIRSDGKPQINLTNAIVFNGKSKPMSVVNSDNLMQSGQKIYDEYIKMLKLNEINAVFEKYGITVERSIMTAIDSLEINNEYLADKAIMFPYEIIKKQIDIIYDEPAFDLKKSLFYYPEVDAFCFENLKLPEITANEDVVIEPIYQDGKYYILKANYFASFNENKYQTHSMIYTMKLNNDGSLGFVSIEFQAAEKITIDDIANMSFKATKSGVCEETDTDKKAKWLTETFIAKLFSVGMLNKHVKNEQEFNSMELLNFTLSCIDNSAVSLENVVYVPKSVIDLQINNYFENKTLDLNKFVSMYDPVSDAFYITDWQKSPWTDEQYKSNLNGKIIEINDYTEYMNGMLITVKLFDNEMAKQNNIVNCMFRFMFVQVDNYEFRIKSFELVE